MSRQVYGLSEWSQSGAGLFIQNPAQAILEQPYNRIVETDFLVKPFISLSSGNDEIAARWEIRDFAPLPGQVCNLSTIPWTTPNFHGSVSVPSSSGLRSKLVS